MERRVQRTAITQSSRKLQQDFSAITVANSTHGVYDVTKVTTPKNQVGSVAYDVKIYSSAMTYLKLLDGI
ncbi:hypothetical protein SMACR_07910 [Sordaria macrospora]|uniref:WGS project CABT00000000 data, contig 2.29 n=2 Tax=Sordaria macrospora TaxID=5147 RepID=F7W523_SORMK|nr:uncharacterized protein SMAC_07910 [Sordaria macrospora k-hell]KAA8632127.1 hypothetical protein SMACR_07910 [Sordaria macrospora]WPJ67160.1 hypothetical protein SMAC4_07910 [Sordaria macrospora]CCC12611.1 unnamed protein product [Sordaria macrospora k-hell]